VGSPAPGLARAFFGDPPPLGSRRTNASLDYPAERVLFEAIERMKAANTTVIIITHRVGSSPQPTRSPSCRAVWSAHRVTARKFRETSGPTSSQARAKSAQPHSIRNARAALAPHRNRSCMKRIKHLTIALPVISEGFDRLETGGVRGVCGIGAASALRRLAVSPGQETCWFGCTLSRPRCLVNLRPPESAAIASGTVESESSRKTIQHLEVHHQGNSGRGW